MALIKEIKPTILLECIGGDLPGNILRIMPQNSTMVCYGNLTHRPVVFDSEDLHWANKNITGLMMFRWVSSLDS